MGALTWEKVCQPFSVDEGFVPPLDFLPFKRKTGRGISMISSVSHVR